MELGTAQTKLLSRFLCQTINKKGQITQNKGIFKYLLTSYRTFIMFPIIVLCTMYIVNQ